MNRFAMLLIFSGMSPTISCAQNCITPFPSGISVSPSTLPNTSICITQTTPGGPYNILITNNVLTGPVSFTVTTGSNVVVDDIVIQSNTTQFTTLRVHGPGGPAVPSGSVNGILDNNSGYLIIADTRIGSSIFAISCGKIASMTVDGDVVTSVIARDPRAAASQRGDIDSLTINGNLTADVTLTNGRLGFVTVLGRIGLPGITRTIRVTGSAGIAGQLHSLKGDTIYSDINVDRQSGEIISRGSLADDSAIDVRSIVPITGTAAKFSFAGDLSGMVTIRPDVAPGDTGPIEIGGSFTGSIDFQRPSLTARQVLIGLNGPGEVWTGGVSYSGVTTPFTLAPGAPDPLDTAPYYKRSSADLGGGAVGLVPFHFHQGVDCVPETDSLLNIAPEEVILEYYGPIAETNAASGVPPFIVERAREGAAQAA